MSTVKANTIEPASGGTVTITGAALTTPALGTPASGNLANCTGLPASSVVGLSNVDNTSDSNKPVSTSQQTALDAKLDKILAYSDTQIFYGAIGNVEIQPLGALSGVYLISVTSAGVYHSQAMFVINAFDSADLNISRVLSSGYGMEITGRVAYSSGVKLYLTPTQTTDLLRVNALKLG